MELRKWYDGHERLAGLKHGECRISFDISITERAPTRSYPVPGVWDFRWGTHKERCEHQSPSRILKIILCHLPTHQRAPLLHCCLLLSSLLSTPMDLGRSSHGMGAMSTTIGQSFCFGSVSQIVGIVRVVCQVWRHHGLAAMDDSTSPIVFYRGVGSDSRWKQP